MTGKTHPTFEAIRYELSRLGASDVEVVWDEEFQPEAGPLVRVTINQAYWHLLPNRLLRMLQDLPDHAGAQGILRQIERTAVVVWRGPAPKESRDA